MNRIGFESRGRRTLQPLPFRDLGDSHRQRTLRIQQHVKLTWAPICRERCSVPAVSEFTAETLADWHLLDRADDVLLCVSELATNALMHGVPPGRGFRLYLDCGGLLHVEVHDSGPGLSRVRETNAGEEDEGGRGLLLVGGAPSGRDG